MLMRQPAGPIEIRGVTPLLSPKTTEAKQMLDPTLNLGQ